MLLRCAFHVKRDGFSSFEMVFLCVFGFQVRFHMPHSPQAPAPGSKSCRGPSHLDIDMLDESPGSLVFAAL